MTVTKRDERIDASYWQYVLEHRLQPSHQLEAMYWAAWKAGGKQVLRDTAELAELVPAVHAMTNTARELVAWLENE